MRRERVATWWGVSAAVVTFVLWFGFPLLSLWDAHPRSPALPGIAAFSIATKGNGIVLPLLIGGLVWIVVGLEPVPGDRRVAAVAGTVGSAMGALSQMRWLSDAQPQQNQTLAAARGQVGFAGWLGAGRLILMLGGLACLATLVLVRWRGWRHRDPSAASAALEGPAPIAVLFLIMSFVSLLVLDNIGAHRTFAGLTATTGAGLTLLLLASILWALLGSERTGLVPDVVIATLGAAGLTGVTIWLSQHEPTFILVGTTTCSLLALALSWLMRCSGNRRWPAIGLCLAMLFLGSLAVPPPGSAWVDSMVWQGLTLLAWPSLGLFLVAALLYAADPTSLPTLAHWLAGLYVLALLAVGPWIGARTLSEFSTQQVLTVVALLFFPVAFVAQTDYRIAVGFLEPRAGRKRAMQDSLSLWMFQVTFIGAALIAYAFFVLRSLPAAGFEAATGGPSRSARPLIGALVAVVLASMAVATNRRQKMAGEQSQLAWTKPASVLAIMAPLLWIVTLIVSYHPAPGVEVACFQIAPSCMSRFVFAALLLAILTAESIVVSSGRLQDVVPGPTTLIVSVLCGAGVFASLMWLVNSGIWSGPEAATFPSALVAASVAFLGGYGVAIFSGIAAARGCKPLTETLQPSNVSESEEQFRYCTEAPPQFNVFQDQFLYCGLALLCVWSAALASARATTGSSGALWSTGTQALAFLAPFASFFYFTVRNNKDHLARQRTRIMRVNERTGRPRNPEAWLALLRRHITFQNWSAFWVAVLSVVGILVILAAEIPHAVELLYTHRPRAAPLLRWGPQR